MKTYVLDASAVIRYLSHGIGEEKVHALIQRAARSEAHLLISVVNWGEALYSLAKMAGLGKAMSAFIVPAVADEASAEAAATVRFHYRLGYADCYAASLAIRMDATLVTTDPDFAKLGKKLKILSLSGDVP
jgi:predicted nucleic acid-binding protein